MKKINIVNKKILYIGVASFHYDKFFAKKLSDLGALVCSYDLENYLPKNYFVRGYDKLISKNKEIYKHNFYEKIFLKNNYDYVLVRHGYQLDEYFLDKLRKINPNAIFINFHWDSIRPQYNYLHIIKYFDKIFSFDVKDCQDHPSIKYLPLFYLDEYGEFKKNNPNNFKQKKNDIIFIGSWRNIERYNLINLTDNLCKKANLNFYHYLYFSFRNQVYSVKNGIIPKQARLRSLSANEILKLFTTTNTIIDFPSSFQTGLTIRTFETLGSGKKLITTNKNIANEPFYNPEYINIIDINNLNLDVDFIKNKPITSIDEVMEDYSLENYINKLLR